MLFWLSVSGNLANQKAMVKSPIFGKIIPSYPIIPCGQMVILLPGNVWNVGYALRPGVWNVCLCHLGQEEQHVPAE